MLQPNLMCIRTLIYYRRYYLVTIICIRTYIFVSIDTVATATARPCTDIDRFRNLTRPRHT